MDAAEYDLLVQKAILWDRAAFGSLFDQHHGEVSACITVCLGYAAQYAEDVLQETAHAAFASVSTVSTQTGNIPLGLAHPHRAE